MTWDETIFLSVCSHTQQKTAENHTEQLNMQLARAHQHRAQRMLCNELGRGALPVPASARTRRTCMIWTCNGRPNVSAQAASTRVSVPPSIGTTPPGTPTVLTVLHNVTTRGQSPVWDSRTQTLYFTDVEDPKVG